MVPLERLALGLTVALGGGRLLHALGDRGDELLELGVVAQVDPLRQAVDQQAQRRAGHQALHEEAFWDEKIGSFVNRSLGEYHVPVNLDVPPIEVHFVPEEDKWVNPIGVKGVGEIGIVGAAAAIANAVYHATGKRIREMPITIDKILAAPEAA